MERTVERATVTPIALSVTEAAAAVGLSKPMIWAEISSGRLKVRRVGRRVLVPLRAINEWLHATDAEVA